MSVLDQGVSSLSNFALTITVARVSGASEFGQFALAYSILVFFLGLSRAGVGEVLLVAYSRNHRRPAAWVARPLGAALAIGMVCAAAILASGAILGGPHFLLWALLAVGGLLAVLQDTARHIAVASGRPRDALILDGIWAIAVLPMAVLSVVRVQPELVLLMWILGAAVSVAVVLRTHRHPDVREGIRWVSMNWRLARVFSSEYALAAAANSVVWFALIPPLGEAGIGSVRGVLVLFSPLNTVFSAITLAVLPELTRAASVDQLRRRLIITFVVTITIALTWSSAVLLVPAAIGEAAIGASWSGAEALRTPAAVHHVLLAAYTVLIVAFRATRLTRQSSTMRGVAAACSLALPVVFAALLGPSGASWGFAVANLIAVVVGTVGVLLAATSFTSSGAGRPSGR